MRKQVLELCVAHDKIVCSFCHKMAERLAWKDVDELISFSRDHLRKRISKWDEKRGVKFSTFACNILRNAIIDYVGRQRRLVPMSVVVGESGEATNWIENVADTNEYDAIGQQRDRIEWLHGVDGTEDGEHLDGPETIADGHSPDALPPRLPETRKACSQAANDVIDICLSTDWGDIFNLPRGKKLDSKKLLERARNVLINNGWSRRDTHVVFKEICVLVRAW